MRPLRGWVLLLCGLLGGEAAADVNDFQLYKLGCPSAATCSSLGVTSASAQLNDDAFRVFVREFAAAISSANLMPPSSLGHDGFAFNADLELAFLKPGGSFQMPTTGTFNGPLLL